MRALPLAALVCSIGIVAGCIGQIGDGGSSPRPPSADAGQDAVIVPGASADGGAPSAPMEFPDFASLHDQAISRTCGLNNGVCHNSKQYPDLHTSSDFMVDTVNRDCNSQVDTRSAFKDACETPGDHLVIPAMKIDEEIFTLDAIPQMAPAGGLSGVTMNLAASIGSPAPVAGAIEIHRGATVFTLPGVTVMSTADRAVTLDLSGVSYTLTQTVQSLLDDRVYPWNEGMVRVADVNRNGTAGASLGIRLIKPGDPMKSFLILRLIDATQGELMPLQCREWSDNATEALGCWIQGLKVDATGTPTNANAPIDYASCNFNPAGKGRCSATMATGYAGVKAVLARGCGGTGCHINESAPAAGLDLSDGKAITSLVQVPSSEVPSMMRVQPGNPEASYLLCKIDPTCAARQIERMPKGGLALPTTDVETVRAWIAAGATTQ
jgi:hypothetical protein